MAGEMASRWCREAINVFLMDDWAVDQFWLLVWDLSAAGFGLPRVVNLSELTGLLALFDVVRPEAASSEATGGRVTSDSFHDCVSRRQLWFTRGVQSLHGRGAVNRWSLQSESTLEARPCTTGNTASR